MISQKRLAYTAAIVSFSLVLGFVAPSVVPAVAAINSHSAGIVCIPTCAGSKGPVDISVWTKNVTQSLKQIIPPPGANIGSVRFTINSTDGTSTTWSCGSPFGTESKPASNSSQSSLGPTNPAPGEVLLVIDMAPYCHVING